MTTPSSADELNELRRRLEEAEETLRAIQSGEVDALVLHDGDAAKVYTLEGADHPYRALIEAMQQGALSLSCDGTILYCNRCFAEMVSLPHERVIGSSFGQYLLPSHRNRMPLLLEAGCTQGIQEELQFQAADGSLKPVSVALSPLGLRGATAVCMVVTDLTQQKQYSELQNINRRKDEFLAMLAHELRNPLAPIQNAVVILEQLGFTDEKLTFVREVIERQVQHMSRLVDDLLDVSRITLGKVQLQKVPLELASILERAIETSRPIIDTRRHSLTLSLPPKGVMVLGDATRLTQVIGNLLTNSAKYTEEGGEIVLATERVGDSIVIRVRDNGLGMPADLLPRVFELFTQGDRSLARSEGGLGIGLTLVRRLVELHDGTVVAHSDGPGRGSEFVVRLPAFEELPVPQENGRREARPANSSQLRVFVVDDNKDGADSLGLLLRLMGHHVGITYTGTDAIPLATSLRPHIVLLDIGLPGISGYEVARELRKCPQFATTVLVAMTGYGQDEDKQRSREAGFDHHLVKPVEAETLNVLLRSIHHSVPVAT